MKTAVIISSSFDVYENLAYETSLFDFANSQSESFAILFLWKNDNCIVIGRNQNPYGECDMEFATTHKIKIARRITGGGAVFHDIGNLNFSFIATNDIYNKENNFRILIQTFAKFGLKVELSGRNDILYAGKKFSGNAYYNGKNASLHHGTILISSKADIISRALTPNKLKYKNIGVKSHKSSVLNLTEVSKDINADVISNTLKDVFLQFYPNRIIEPQISKGAVARLKNEYKSKKYIFKKFQEAGDEINADFPWGHLHVKFLLENGSKPVVSITSDTLDTFTIEAVENVVNMQGKILKNDFSELQKTCNPSVLNDILRVMKEIVEIEIEI